MGGSFLWGGGVVGGGGLYTVLRGGGFFFVVGGSLLFGLRGGFSFFLRCADAAWGGGSFLS